MPKTVTESFIPYFYKKAQTVLTGYEIDLANNGTYSTKYVANNEDVSSYVALAIKRGTITTEDGTVLNELEIGLDNVSLDFRQYVISGALERKPVKINLLFVSSAGSLLGTVLLYWGLLDAPKGDEDWVTLSVRPFEMLEREYPRRVYQIGCNWRFCDSSCGLDLTDFAFTGDITAQSDGLTFTISTGEVVNYWVPGYLKLVDLDDIDNVRPIGVSDSGSITLRVPFDFTVESGTTVKLQKLCAKNPDACQFIYDNYSEYGGFPNVPKQPIL